MNREQYAAMLQDIYDTRVSGGDVAACIERYQKLYKYVYVYNDSCFKKIFGAIPNRKVAASFLNAVLKLEGPSCIGSLDFVDPSVPGGPFVKSVTSDLVAEDGGKNRIVIEVQHRGDDSFKDRLVFYTACHTMKTRVPGEPYVLRKLDFIALQMFDTFPDTKEYRHCVQLRNQNNDLFFGKHALTIVEVHKFLNSDFAADDSRLAEWLRAIDDINNEKEVVDWPNPLMKDLQNACRLSNFSVDYLLTEAKNMTDREYERSMDRKEARAEGLEEGRAEGRAEGRTEGTESALAAMAACNASPELIAAVKARLSR